MSTPKLVFPIFATRYVLCANVEVSSYSKISVPQNQYWMFHPWGWQKVQLVLPLNWDNFILTQNAETKKSGFWDRSLKNTCFCRKCSKNPENETTEPGSSGSVILEKSQQIDRRHLGLKIRGTGFFKSHPEPTSFYYGNYL